MSRRSDVDVQLEVEPRTERPTPRPVDKRSFHVALLGDFGGRGGGAPVDALEAVAVDRDEVDAVLARFAPAAWIGGAGADGGLEIPFRELEDFHPDGLLERVPLFRSIREMGSVPERPAAPSPEPPEAPVDEMLSGSVLDRIVDQQDEEDEGGGRRPGGGGGDPLRRWVDEVVRPHLQVAPAAEDAALEARVEGLVANAMREVLRDPGFRRLEALWRGVDFLVRRLETGPRLTVHLVDVAPARLADDEKLASFRELLRRGHRDDPWSVVAALWDVGARPEDLVLLREMARMAAAAGTVLLAGADPALAGLPSLADAGDRGAWGEPHPLWSALRREPEASCLGLALPRFLLRLPYGREGEPCEALELEEIRGVPTPGEYLWGAAALPLVLVLGRAFSRAGPRLLDALDPEVDGLPLHVYDEGGEARVTPCTEAALTHHDVDRLAENGMNPLSWSRGSDAVRVETLRSAADPPASLAGWWRG